MAGPIKLPRNRPLLTRILILMSLASIASQLPSQNPSVAQSNPAPPYQSAGARKMAALLQKIFSENDWKADPNKPAERVPYYKSLLQRNLSMPNEVLVRMEMAKEMLRTGNSEDAINALEEL